MSACYKTLKLYPAVYDKNNSKSDMTSYEVTRLSNAEISVEENSKMRGLYSDKDAILSLRMDE